MQGDEGAEQQRVDALLDDVRARLANGEIVDEQEILDGHPELLPELTIQLRMTLRIHQVKATESLGTDSTEESRFDHLRDALAQERPEYEIGEVLGVGGQGAVFRASHKTLKRDVAIKVLIHGQFSTKRQRERFLREVEISALMQHENIAIVHDCGLVDQCPYAVMEYVDGATLNDYLALENPDIVSRLRLIQKIAAGINYAHQRGVIHRDLKPQNILVTDGGQPKIVDFGLAKSLSEQDNQSVFSREDEVVGTLQYFSPEQAAGESGSVDVRTDVYGLGLIFYEMMTGRLPYPTVTGTQALKDQIISTSPSRLAPALLDGQDHDISTSNAIDIEAIIFKALEKRQEERYQTAQELLDDLNRYFRGEPVEARTQTFFYLATKLARRRRKAVAVAIAFLITVIAAAVVSTSLYFRASHQRDRAVTAVGFSQNIVDFMLAELDYDLSRLPGGSLLQKKLNQHLIDELARLQTLQLNLDLSPASQARLAFNIGVIFHQLARTKDANKSFEHAKALAEQAGSDAMPTAIAASIALAPSNEDGLEQLKKAAQRAHEFSEGSPATPDYQILRARSLMRGTKLAVKSHRLEDAVELGNEVFGIESSESESEQLDRIQSETYRWLGTAYEALGDCELAESLLEKALNQVDRILERQPADIRALQNRLQFQRSLADIYHKNKRNDEALTLISRAFKDAELLIKIAPNEVEIVADVIATANKLAHFRIEETLSEIEATFRQATEWIEAAKRRFEATPQLLEQEALLNSLRYRYFRSRNAVTAEDALNLSIEMARRVKSQWPDYEPIDSLLALVLTKQADQLVDRQACAEALEVFAEVRFIRETQLQRSPKSFDLKLKNCSTSYTQARILGMCGQPKAARNALIALHSRLYELRDQFDLECQANRLNQLLQAVEDRLK